MNTNFTLQVAYQEQGIINLQRRYLNLVGIHLSVIKIYIGSVIFPINGTLYTENPALPRLRGGNELSEWFQTFQIGQVLNVTIINPVTFWIHSST